MTSSSCQDLSTPTDFTRFDFTAFYIRDFTSLKARVALQVCDFLFFTTSQLLISTKKSSKGTKVFQIILTFTTSNE